MLDGDRVDVTTCEPDGLVNAVREKLFTKSFWRGQEFILEGMVARYPDAETPGACGKLAPGRDRTFCIVDWNRQRRELEACYKIAHQRCEAAGGRCTLMCHRKGRIDFAAVDVVAPQP